MAYLTIRKTFTMVQARLGHCILFLILVTIYRTYGNLRNYTLYRLVALTKRDRQILYIIHKNFAQSDFLNGVTNEAAIPMHIAVEDEKVKAFEKLLNNTDSLYTKFLYYSYQPNPVNWHHFEELMDDNLVAYRFNDFPTILQIYRYWETKYPNIFKKIVIGRTHGQNDIIILKVSGEVSMSKSKHPAVFILGGEEGRDWISPAIVLTYVKKLLEASFGDWTKRFDTYFLPVLNPDGYNYSMYEDRFWARNRNQIRPRVICTDHKEAIGVNIDRNWLHRNRGDKVCSKMFFGGYLSEEETYNLSEFLNSIAPHTLAFFSVKGFNNLITTPYADKDKGQNNYDTIKEILQHITSDMNAQFNKAYYYGITRRLLFNYSGNCADWVKEYLNVPVVITFYMQHETKVLPDTIDIVPLYEEFSTGVNKILSLTIDLYGPLFNSQWKLKNNTIILLLITLCIIL